MNVPRSNQGNSAVPTPDTSRPREGCSGSNMNGSLGDAASDNGRCGMLGCGGTGDCRDGMPLAYVYAPNQKFCMLYSARDALAHGTLFEELYKPMEVYGREHGKK